MLLGLTLGLHCRLNLKGRILAKTKTGELGMTIKFEPHSCYLRKAMRHGQEIFWLFRKFL